MRRSMVLVLILAMMAVSAAAAAPKNIVFMIGDGMGSGAITLARLAVQAEGKTLAMDTMRCGGTIETRSANAVVTDSAAAGTALAAGYKTNNGMISVLPDGTPVLTILEAAQGLKKAVGLVTNTTITHATPAVFASHVPSRGSEAEIAVQMIDLKVDVLLGGGKQNFIPKSQSGSKREDETDLIAQARQNGYRFVETRDELLKAGKGRLLGLFQMGALTTESPEPTLAEMSGRAIQTLSANKKGFFLMIEGGQIDWKAHANDAAGLVKQTLDFDAAVGTVLTWARKHKDTLVVVTADHETGGIAIVYPDKDSTDLYRVSWASKDHSGNNVPLLADGPGAAAFGGAHDNTDVPKRFAKLWGIKVFPKKLK